MQNIIVLLVAALSASNVAASPINSTPTPAITSAAEGTYPAAATTTPAPTTEGCTTRLFHGAKFGALNKATCTFYESYTTVTEYVDCGGCTLEMVAMGPGPAVHCSANTQLPLGTETMTACSTTPNAVAAASTPAPTTQ
ncbi:hypothetical protein BFW01_g1602 [Lasiodiplodia theobromae]|uniref:Uncharacterized protein n=1 Tax=Lasiodiplodia theobromae TaxID=45133 RepID=A0A5N5D0F4_9PEZI|nr:uncharacterized protein LTHEOB_2890 [Lasiodiplodia theobromae]KAB2571057.1 hypothetical protein DBV05_g10291 [Lasiodiplodia theobromae]KAF4534915.1 hypothetical protein LTHEOB_2890 [Lasiodiplodia theobromae]KAF9641619.1 hypothetical protein BFW01_g1602 [Lasiodiplodia theobromae]